MNLLQKRLAVVFLAAAAGFGGYTYLTSPSSPISAAQEDEARFNAAQKTAATEAAFYLDVNAHVFPDGKLTQQLDALKTHAASIGKTAAFDAAIQSLATSWSQVRAQDGSGFLSKKPTVLKIQYAEAMLGTMGNLFTELGGVDALKRVPALTELVTGYEAATRNLQAAKPAPTAKLDAAKPVVVVTTGKDKVTVTLPDGKTKPIPRPKKNPKDSIADAAYAGPVDAQNPGIYSAQVQASLHAVGSQIAQLTNDASFVKNNILPVMDQYRATLQTQNPADQYNLSCRAYNVAGLLLQHDKFTQIAGTLPAARRDLTEMRAEAKKTMDALQPSLAQQNVSCPTGWNPKLGQ